jgi:hypothetical protein
VEQGQLNFLGNTSLPEQFLSFPCNFESRDEILLKGGRLWRPRFLITINANDRISRVKPVKPRSNLGQPGSSPQKPRQWTLMNPLTKPTHTRGQPLVKGTAKTVLTIDVSECRPELCRVLQNSPKHSKIYLYESCPSCWGTQLSCRLAFQILSGNWWKTRSTDSTPCFPEQAGIQCWHNVPAKSVEKNTRQPLPKL